MNRSISNYGKRRISAALIVCLLAASMTAGCGQAATEGGTETGESKLVVSVTKPAVGNVEAQGEFIGTLEYEDETTVFPKLSGEVTETFFEEGDYVNAGDLLFQLDDAAYRIGLASAKAVYDSTKAGMDMQLGALDMGRNSDVNTLKTAQEGAAQIRDSYAYYESQYSDLEDNINDLEDDIDDMDDDKSAAKKKLKKAKLALKAAVAAAKEATAAYKDALRRGVSGNQLSLLRMTMDEANNAVDTCSSTVKALQSAISGYTTGADTMEGTIDSLESSERGINFQKNNLNYSYNQAQRGAALAQQNLDYDDLYKIPGTEKTADATIRQVQANVDSAQLQLDYTQITAPVSGTIKTKSVEKFGMAQAGMPAYVITNSDTIQASFKVPEATFRTFSKGQEVVIDRNGNEYSGKIVELDNQVDAASGMFKVTAAINASGADLVTGTTVKVTTRTKHVENVLTVPVDCVYYEAGQSFVYTVENGIVRKNTVQIGINDDDTIQILEGLDADAELVNEWSSNLRDGLEVEVR